MLLKRYIKIFSIATISLTTCIKTVDAQVLKNLDSLFNSLYNGAGFNGAILIAEKGIPIYNKSFGYANLDTKQLLTNKTMFELASVSKQFTAMAIMQLHEKGKLKYNDDLTMYFPQLRYKGVTINHLIHHTSGIIDFMGWDKEHIDVSKINYNKDILNALVKVGDTLSFKPGEQFSYSNTNYLLLALIVEKISGLPFNVYMDKFIFKPLNMSDTKVYGARFAKQKISDYANGYVYSPSVDKFVLNDSIKENNYLYYLDGVSGPYGISSTTEDLLKWDQGLYSEKIISKKEQELSYLPQKLNNGENAKFMGLNYGFGWFLNEPQKFNLHTGGLPGYKTLIVRYYDKNQVVIVLMNKDNVLNLYELGFNIENIINGREFNIPEKQQFKKAINLSLALLEQYDGIYSYKEAPELKYTINTIGNNIYAQLSGQRAVDIYPESETVFFYTVVDAKIKFSIGEKGSPTQLTLYQNGKELKFIKQ